jgi:hypothetical protein
LVSTALFCLAAGPGYELIAEGRGLLGIVRGAGPGEGRLGRAAGRLQAGVQVCGQKPRPERAQHVAVQPPAVLKADLELGGMHVHVHGVGRQVDPQEGDRVATRKQQSSIGLAQRVLQRAVADVPAVEKQILHPRVRAAVAGVGHEAPQVDARLAALDGY